MPVEVIYEPGVSRFVESRMWGEITRSEFEQLFRDTLEALDKGTDHSLLDLSGLTTSMIELFRFTLSSTVIRTRSHGKIRRAIVEPNDMSFSHVAHLAAGVLAPLGIAPRTFPTREAAIAWLLADEESAEP